MYLKYNSSVEVDINMDSVIASLKFLPYLEFSPME